MHLGQIPRYVRLFQSGHPEAFRGRFATSDRRESLPGVDYGKKGVDFTIAFSRFHLLGSNACKVSN